MYGWLVCVGAVGLANTELTPVYAGASVGRAFHLSMFVY